jgi:hypothetical protein
MVMICVAGQLPAGAAGTQINEVKYGFSFLIPVNWNQVPLSGKNVVTELNKLIKNDPSLRSSLTNEVKQDAKNGIKFFAIGPVLDGFASNVNIIVTSSAGYPNNSSYFGIAESQISSNLTKEGLKNLDVTEVQLPFGKEIEGTYKLPLAMTGVQAYGMQLYVKYKKHLEFVTFTSHSKSVNEAALNVLIHSWKWN